MGKIVKLKIEREEKFRKALERGENDVEMQMENLCNLKYFVTMR